MNFSATSTSAVIPINDIRGLDSMGYAKGEKQLRWAIPIYASFFNNTQLSVFKGMNNKVALISAITTFFKQW